MVVSAIAWASIQTAIQAWVVAITGLADTNVYWEGQGQNRVAGPFIELSIPSIYQPAHDWKRKARNPLLGQGPEATTDITSVNVGASSFAATAHRFVNGDGPVGIESSGSVPDPLVDTDDYWVIVLDANTLQLASTFINSGCNYVGKPITPIVLSDAGSGSMEIVLRDNAVRAGKEVNRTSEGIREVTVQIECFGARDNANNANGIPPTPRQLVSDVLASAPLYADTLDIAGAGISTIGIADIQDGIRMVNVKVGSINEQRAQTQISLYVNSSLTITGGKVDGVSIGVAATMPDGETVITIPPTTIVVDE